MSCQTISHFVQMINSKNHNYYVVFKDEKWFTFSHLNSQKCLYKLNYLRSKLSTYKCIIF